MILRRACADDAAAIAVLLRTTFRISLPFLPELYTAEQDLGFIRAKVLVENTVWVAEAKGEVAGFIAYRDGWIDHLYVHPDFQGQGIGPLLLEKALEDRKPRRLWTFQQNARARRFYEARGFQPIQFTDGADNEEKTPDVLYLWNS